MTDLHFDDIPIAITFFFAFEQSLGASEIAVYGVRSLVYTIVMQGDL